MLLHQLVLAKLLSYYFTISNSRQHILDSGGFVHGARVAEAVRQVILETFKIDAAAAADRLEIDAVDDWTSLGHLHLVTNLEKHFGVMFSQKEIVEMLSEDEIVKVVVSKVSPTTMS